MNEDFAIASLTAEKGGTIGICGLPGRHGDLQSDLEILFRWKPDMVISMTELSEMEQAGCHGIGAVLAARGITWFHLPIRDYGRLQGGSASFWPELSEKIHRLLDGDGKVLLHCRGGHGRSGMIAMRLLAERDEHPETALKRLRQARPGAVETSEQASWAALPVTA